MFSRLVWNTWAQLIFLPLLSLRLELQIHAILLCMCVLLGTDTQSLFHASHKVHLQCHHHHFLSCVCGQMCVQIMWLHVGAGVTVRYLP